MQKQDWRGALQNYDAAFKWLGRARAQEFFRTLHCRKNLATLDVKRADALIRRGNELLDRPEPVINPASRLIEDALQRYRSAAGTFEKMTSAPGADVALYGNLFDVRIKIGDVLVRQHKYRDALDEYHLASKAAEQAGSHPGAWSIGRSKLLGRAGAGG